MTARDLDAAAAEVLAEWQVMAEMAAALAGVTGSRTLTDRALLEALFVHGGCLVNFLCGNWRGARAANDLRPRDFLGYEWRPPTNSLSGGCGAGCRSSTSTWRT